MTRRSTTSLRPTRQRRTGSAPRRIARPPLADIRNLGFSCFRLVSADDPEIEFAFCRVLEPRVAMGAFARR